jgi:DNA-binding response OmpR family regulator
MTRILVVDDSAFTGDAIAWALERSGFEVRVARDLWDLEGEEREFDLVLMDVVLQEAYGDDLAPLLRDTRGLACPILLVSSLPEGELAQRAEDAGVEGYISKREGLAAIVARARALLGREAGTAPAIAELAGRFEIASHHRVRRVVHVSARPDHWNAPAIAAEAHALAGDADLVGASALSEAARACRDAAQLHGTTGPTAAVTDTVLALAKLAGGERPIAGKLLVIDDSGFSREKLMPGFDRAGYVVVEAATLVETRQKLRAIDYDAIVVDGQAAKAEPTLLAELADALPGVPVAILADQPGDARTLAKTLGEQGLLDAVARLIK